MRVLLLGAGVMGESILAGLLDAGAEPSDVTVLERHAGRREEISARYGVATPVSGDGVSGDGLDCDVLLVAVKPADVPTALEPLSDGLAGRTVVVSVAAGLTTARLESWLPAGQPVVRAMPNTPALVRAAVSAISPGRHADASAMAAAETLMSAVGTVVVVPESQLDAVTAVSGSGPAYVFLVVEALIEAGVRAGLSRDLAHTLTVATLVGSSRLLVETGEHPALLRERVTSPGGTTAAALHALEQHGLRSAFLDAVLANRDRARELAAAEGPADQRST